MHTTTHQPAIHTSGRPSRFAVAVVVSLVALAAIVAGVLATAHERTSTTRSASAPAGSVAPSGSTGSTGSTGSNGSSGSNGTAGTGSQGQTSNNSSSMPPAQPGQPASVAPVAIDLGAGYTDASFQIRNSCDAKADFTVDTFDEAIGTKFVTASPDHGSLERCAVVDVGLHLDRAHSQKGDFAEPTKVHLGSATLFVVVKAVVDRNPVISNVFFDNNDPANCSSTQLLGAVSANVDDPKAAVTLYSSEPTGKHYTPMTRNKAGQFVALLGPFPPKTVVTYWISAVDTRGSSMVTRQFTASC
ncbi:MAG: hypothetical protein QOI95_1103 [Acidimicrobiaceae bacterium]|jgi:hypothetical protein